MAKAKKSSSVIVAGLGSFGTTIATEMARFGHIVLAIDKEERPVSAIAETVHEAVIADVGDEQALRAVGAGNYDMAVIAVGEELESSILALINLRVLGVQKIWARAKNKTHHRILSKLGVERVIQPEVDSGHHVAQRLNNPMVRDYFSVGNGFHVVDFLVTPDIAGRKLQSLRIAEAGDLRLAGGMRGTESLNPAPDLVLEEGDHLFIVGQRADLMNFAENL
ncbi:potassium channel family protein [Paracoccaceae bacterium GXU_MW_L88]